MDLFGIATGLLIVIDVILVVFSIFSFYVFFNSEINSSNAFKTRFGGAIEIFWFIIGFAAIFVSGIFLNIIWPVN